MLCCAVLCGMMRFCVYTGRYFVEQQVDYVILEVGIGGRFDSTNFVLAPVASVVTSVSLDHQVRGYCIVVGKPLCIF